MIKRTLKIGAYDTAAHGWTLTPGWKLSDPEQKTKYIEKSGGDGSWDLSTAMTDGLPRYKDRSLTATLECSEGNRTERERCIAAMVNQLDGLEWRIVLPDRPGYYLTGRIHVAVNYSDLAHASVTITANCAPWLYKQEETILTVTAGDTKQSAVLTNSGRLAVVPTITVDSDAEILLEYGNNSTALSAGTYEWAALLLTPGNHPITYSGEGKLTFTFREAVLR